MNDQRIMLVGDGSRPAVAQAARELVARVAGLAEVVVEHLTLAEPPPEVEASVAVVLGGDGSMLWAARHLAPRGVPMAGVNLGKFGFLASFSLEEMTREMPDMLSGRREPSEWLMLQAETEASGASVRVLALNDVVLTGAEPARMVHIELEVNGERVTTYGGDGLAVATPVGSTAYSLSAGGPIVDPMLDAMIVTPICAHSLSNRPLVVPPEAELTVRLAGRSTRAVLAADGQEVTAVGCGQPIRIGRAEVRARFFTTASRTYYQTLRDKLGWGGQPNYAQSAGAD